MRCGEPTKQTKEAGPVLPFQVSTDPCLPFTLITVLSLALLRPICELVSCQTVLKSFTASCHSSEIRWLTEEPEEHSARKEQGSGVERVRAQEEWGMKAEEQNIPHLAAVMHLGWSCTCNCVATLIGPVT